MGKNVVSAVIPTLNRAHDLSKAVKSIVLQSRIPDELIIVDQSQNTESRCRVEKCLQGHVLAERLVYIHDSSISGLVEAKQVAVGKSKADIVMFLEDDVVLSPDYIETLEKGFVDYPAMMGSCGVVQAVEGSGELYTFFFRFFHRGIFYDPRVGIHGIEVATNKGLIRSNYLSGGLSAYRREVFEKIPFDTINGFFALEDIDFSTRAVRFFGKDNFYINTAAILDHRVSPQNRAKLQPKYERKFREFICFYKKNRTSVLDIFSLVWLTLGLLLEALMVAANQRCADPLIGSYKGFMNGIKQQIKCC